MCRKSYSQPGCSPLLRQRAENRSSQISDSSKAVIWVSIVEAPEHHGLLCKTGYYMRVRNICFCVYVYEILNFFSRHFQESGKPRRCIIRLQCIGSLLTQDYQWDSRGLIKRRCSWEDSNFTLQHFHLPITIAAVQHHSGAKTWNDCFLIR